MGVNMIINTKFLVIYIFNSYNYGEIYPLEHLELHFSRIQVNEEYPYVKYIYIYINIHEFIVYIKYQSR